MQHSGVPVAASALAHRVGWISIGLPGCKWWTYDGIRRYGETEVARALFIKTAQRIGFTLNEIAQLRQLDGGTR